LNNLINAIKAHYQINSFSFPYGGFEKMIKEELKKRRKSENNQIRKVSFYSPEYQQT
jgi:predicted transposase YbfD/YdcC